MDPEPSSSSSVITPEDVLESLMNDGTIDTLRLKIMNQLKTNEELRNTTIRMAEQSKVLNTPGAEKQTKRELFDALRQELEAPVLEKASRSVWDLILDNSGLGKEISETVERVYCRLSGREPPLFPIPSAETTQNDGTESKEGEEKEEGNENQKEKSSSKTKKRSYNEVNVEAQKEDSSQIANEVAGKSSDHLGLPEGHSKSPSSAPKT